MKKGLLTNFISDIKQRRNLELYITLIIIFGVVLAGLFKISTEAILMDLVLVTLALLLYTVVDLRRTNEEVTQQLKHFTTGDSALSFLHTWDQEPFRKSLMVAKKELCFCAVALYSFLAINIVLIQDFLARDGSIKCILLNPKSSALNSATESYLGYEKDPKEMEKQIDLSVKILVELAANYPNKVEVRFTEHVPSAIITILDRTERDGIMFVTLVGFEQQAYDRPSMILKKEVNGKWFDFYESSFQHTWEWQNTNAIDLTTFNKQ